MLPAKLPDHLKDKIMNFCDMVNSRTRWRSQLEDAKLLKNLMKSAIGVENLSFSHPPVDSDC